MSVREVSHIFLIFGAAFIIASENNLQSDGLRFIVIGRTTNFACVMPHNETTTSSFRWYFSRDQDAEMKLLRMDYHVKISGAVMFIRMVQEKHAGKYKCCRAEGTCAESMLYILEFFNFQTLIHNSKNSSSTVILSPNSTLSITVYHGVFYQSIQLYKNSRSLIIAPIAEERDKKEFQIHAHCNTHDNIYWMKALLNDEAESYRINISILSAPVPVMEDVVSLWNVDFIDFVCKGVSYPVPEIQIVLYKCTGILYKIRSCVSPMLLPITSMTDSMSEYSREFHAVSRVKGPFNSSALIECHASNDKGWKVALSRLLLRNFKEEMVFEMFSPTGRVQFGETIMVQCQVDIYNFTGVFNFHSEEISRTQDGYVDKYAWVANMTFKNVTERNIFCKAQRKDGTFHVKNMTLSFRSEALYFVTGSETQIIEVNDNDKSTLNCDAIGHPVPQISWRRRNHLQTHKETMIVASLEPWEKHVNYECIAANEFENISKSWKIKLISKMTFTEMALIGGIIVVFMVFLSTIIIIVIRSKTSTDTTNEYKMEDHLRNAIPSEFWFPKERLKFGRTLGKGEYGVVVLAEAENILVSEPLTTVAVKKTKSTKAESVMRMLVSELKVMIEVGQHLNVVNFLGAVTTTTKKQSLMIIMEYCEHGSVLEFMRENKSNFIDCMNDLEGGWTVAVQETELSKRSRNVGNAISFQTTDLICWAAHIANGMAYLASKNVLHSDLAARNVLLCDKNVVKISDFGLAKMVHEGTCYKKRGNDPMPIKWLALESLSENLFSVKSDVWAYGILLWELFSLGTSPYPGIDITEVHDQLLQGYRMDRAEYANEEVHEIMLKCWYVNRTLRPAFDELATTFNQMLPTVLQSHYIALSHSYIRTHASKPEYLETM